MNERRDSGRMELGLVEYIESAHKVGQGKMHGHNFKIEVVFEGEYTGGKMDFHSLKPMLKDVVRELDHRVLNDILEVPVIENIARYIANKLSLKLPLKSVAVWETEDRWCRLVL